MPQTAGAVKGPRLIYLIDRQRGLDILRYTGGQSGR